MNPEIDLMHLDKTEMSEEKTKMNEEKTKILIVEDDEFLLKSVARIISSKGYAALMASNGRDALEIIKNEHPALILSDLRMPVMDGLDLLEEVSIENPETPVIIFSGVGAKPDIIQAFRSGAWDYITKPIEDFDELIEKIEQTLIRAQMAYGYSESMEKAVEKKTRDYEEEHKIRQELEVRIAHAKQELERMIDAIREPIALIDSNHRLVRVNKAMADIYNCPLPDVIGRIAHLSTNGLNNREQAGNDLEAVLQGRQISGRFTDKSGQVEYEVNMYPYYAPDQVKAKACVYIARDISNRKGTKTH